MTRQNRRFFDSKRKGPIFVEEKEVFHLTQDKAEDCRFEYIDHGLRLVECVTHRGKVSHGYRLFPPHLWNLVDGLIYYRKNAQDKNWQRWYPNLAENKGRLKIKEKNVRQT